MHLIAKASLANRALIALITVCVAIFGGVALANLRTELAPDITLPQVVIATTYSGASADIVAHDVTEPIEAAVQSVAGLELTSGTSRPGSSTVIAAFEYGVDLTVTEQRVQQAVNRLQNALPEGVTPTVLTGSIADFPIIQIAVETGDNEAALVDRIEQVVLPRLERIDGVRDATLSGAEGQRVTITPDAAALAARGMTTQNIQSTLASSGLLAPGGSIAAGDQTLDVQVGGALTSVDAVASLPLGPGVSLSDVAVVELASDPTASVTLVNGEPAITISVSKAQTANTVAVSAAVQELLPTLEDDLDGSNLTVVFDQAPFITQSIDALAVEGLLGLAFAVLVILIFLLSVRSTIVTAVSIPVSVLMTFIGLWASGFTMNVLTLGALTIAIGRVVDDSIVVIESIKRHLVLAPSRLAAILDAVREVAGAVTASTITTVIVFLPLAFVTDITGELFRPFALTVTIALLSSLIVSLTIVPVLAFWMLRSADADAMVVVPEPVVEPPRRSWFTRRAARIEQSAVPQRVTPTERPGKLRLGYRPVLKFALRRPALVLVAAVVVLGVSGALAPLMAVNFLGSTGQTTLSATQSLEPGTSLAAQVEAAEATSSALEDLEGMEIVQATVSQSSTASAFGRSSTGIRYSMTAEDGADVEALTERVRDVLNQQPGDAAVEQSGGFGSNDITIDVHAPTESELSSATAQLREAVASVDGVAQVTDSLEAAQPIVQVTIDRQAAADRGLTEAALTGLVAQAMSPQPVGSIQLDGTVVTVFIAASDPAANIDELRALAIATPVGPATLDELADVSETFGPVRIDTIDSERTATLTVTPGSGNTGAVAAAVADAVADTTLAGGASAEIGGVSTQITDAFTQLGLAALVAVLLVYVVMVATFRSLLQPFMLLVSIPFAATGAILMQLVTGVPLGVASMVGVLMLVGIVVTNAIVLIDLVNQYRDRGLPVREALMEGAERRLRPVLMTAAATVFALVPMALGITGHGGFISQPLAIVVIGGLLSSTVLTLIVLPALYLLVEGGFENRRIRRGRGTRADDRAAFVRSARTEA